MSFTAMTFIRIKNPDFKCESGFFYVQDVIIKKALKDELQFCSVVFSGAFLVNQ